jgi:hypothetical protein
MQPFFADHRMEGLRDYVGWDLKVLGALPFIVRKSVPINRPAHSAGCDRFLGKPVLQTCMRWVAVG